MTPTEFYRSDDLNEFQRSCLERMLALLNHLGVEKYGIELEGVGERYAILRIHGMTTRLDAYVYSDEAGFYQGEQWLIWESQDYPEGHLLCETFLEALERALRTSFPDS